MTARMLASESLIVLVDVQERLLPAIPAGPREKLLRNAGILLESASLLGARVIATEQYPEGLGATAAELVPYLDRASAKPMPKVTFDAIGEPPIRDAVMLSGAKNAILVGMETHICVYQTARSCLALGLTTFVVSDATASRSKERHGVGLELSRAEGARVTVAEAVVFDWMERAGTDTFRAVAKLVK